MGISSDYSALARTNFQGMVSGLETDTLVEALMLNAQSKIDKANQKYTLYEYKQDAYRDVISTIDTFNSSYSSYTSSNSLISNSFFNQMTSTSTSSNFTVTGTSSAVDGDMSMSIQQLATTTTLSGSSINSVDTISGSLDIDALLAASEYTVAFEVTNGDTTTTVQLTQDHIDALFTDGKLDLNADFGIDVEFTYSAGQMEMVSDDYSFKVVDSGSTDLGLQKLGLSVGDTTGSIEVKDENGDLITTTGFSTSTDKDAEASMTITLDGVSKEVKLSSLISTDSSDPDVNTAATLEALQKELDSLFGSGNITLTATGSGGFDITTTPGRQVTITGSDVLEDGLGIDSGSTNVLYSGNTVSEVLGKDLFVEEDSDGKFAYMNINGAEIKIYEDYTMSQMMSAVNNSGAGVTMTLDSFTSTFSLTSDESGAGYEMDFTGENSILKAALGITEDGTLQELCSNTEMVDGQVVSNFSNYSVGVNSKFTLNNVETERGSNVFTVNGVTFELNEVHETGVTDTVTTSRDVDSVIEGITAFIDDYNAMIEKLNATIDEKYDSEYPPLTDAQKEEMSESEIANWEEKAKTGVLANDDLISDYLTAMRTAMYTSYGENGTSLWQIGIEASDEWTENGKLYIDEDKLRQTLMEDPDIVRDLFTGTDGLISGVSSVCKTYANTSSGSPGLLVEKAGVAGTATEYNNTLYNWMQTTLSQLEKLETNYTLQYDRYWAAFTNMETVLSTLSSQSAWLSQQFGY